VRIADQDVAQINRKSDIQQFINTSSTPVHVLYTCTNTFPWTDMTGTAKTLSWPI